MVDTIKISVLIPVYNTSKFLERCLYSILNQTMSQNVECVIVNDCSPDNSVDVIDNIVDSYSGNMKIKIINHDWNRGLAAARNTGLDNAKGEYIICIDSDDYCELNMLERMYSIALSDNADVVVSDFYLSYKNKEKRIFQNVILQKEEYIKQLINVQISVCVWNKLVRRSLYENNNIRASEGINMGEDYMVSLMLAAHVSKISHIREAFVHYVLYNSESFMRKSKKEYLDNRIDGLRIVKKYYRNCNMLSLFEKDFEFKEISMKLAILRLADMSLQQMYNEKIVCKKESIVKHPYMPFYWKLAILSAEYNSLTIFNIMDKLINLVKR